MITQDSDVSTEEEYLSSEEKMNGNIEEVLEEGNINKVKMTIEETNKRDETEFWKILEKFPNWKEHNRKKEPIEIGDILNEMKLDIKCQLNHIDFDFADNIISTGGVCNKVTYAQVEHSIAKLYYTEQEYYSSAMDILSSFIKGQKLIYMESKHYCDVKLN